MSTIEHTAERPGRAGHTDSAAVRARRAVSGHRETLAALALYVGYAIFLTWPLITDPGGLLSGPTVSGDLGGSVSQVAYVVQHHVFPFAPATLHALDAPQGLTQQWVLNWADFPGTAPLFVMGYVIGAVAAHAVFLLLGYVLTGLAMFLLTRRLFGSFPAALLAGFAFAFFPWAVDKIGGHFPYMYGCVLVLPVWRMLELGVRPTVRNGLLAGCATAFAMWFTPYFILIAGAEFATLAIVVLWAGGLRGELGIAVKGVALAVVPIVVLFGFIGVLASLAGSGAGGTVRTQSIDELYAYSARWLEWLLPDRNNVIFGGLTRGYLTSHLHGSNFSESSLYLGVSVIVLALGGIALAAARVRALRAAAARDIRVVGAVAGCGLALVAAWASSPPKVHVLGVWVPTPSLLIFHITSTWRVYSRFVELLELGMCVLLAFAAAALFARRGRLGGLALFALLATVLALDLWARPAIRTTSITKPPAEYVWLQQHPGGTVADYPIEAAVAPDYAELFWQMVHRHPLLQGYTANSETESMKLDLVDLRESKTAPGLAALGVRYIVVHPGQVGGGAANLRRQGYIPRFAGPDGSVWQVGAQPAATRVEPLDDFSLVEGGPNDEYRWMVGPGALGVFARNCSSCAGVVTFASSSADVGRTLTVREQQTNQILARARIPPGVAVPVRVPGVTLQNGEARLLLSTDIPAMRPKDGDPRVLSISVGEPRFSRLRPRTRDRSDGRSPDALPA